MTFDRTLARARALATHASVFMARTCDYLVDVCECWRVFVCVRFGKDCARMCPQRNSHPYQQQHHHHPHVVTDTHTKPKPKHSTSKRHAHAVRILCASAQFADKAQNSIYCNI